LIFHGQIRRTRTGGAARTAAPHPAAARGSVRSVVVAALRREEGEK